MMKRFKKLWLFVLSALMISICAAPSFAQDPPLQYADLLSGLKQTGEHKVSLHEKDASLQEYDLNGVRFSVVNLPEGVPFTLDDFREMTEYIRQEQANDFAARSQSRDGLNWTTNHTWSKDKYNTHNPDCFVYTEGTGQRAFTSTLNYIRSRGGCGASGILGTTSGLHEITETYTCTTVTATIDWPPSLEIEGRSASISTPTVSGNSAYLYREDIVAQSLQSLLILEIGTSASATINGSTYITSISDRVRYMD